MARATRNSAKSKPKNATTTRAKSKEVPTAVPTTRRTTRARSNEPLISLDDPEKAIRKSRRTVSESPKPEEAPIVVSAAPAPECAPLQDELAEVELAIPHEAQEQEESEQQEEFQASSSPFEEVLPIQTPGHHFHQLSTIIEESEYASFHNFTHIVDAQKDCAANTNDIFSLSATSFIQFLSTVLEPSRAPEAARATSLINGWLEKNSERPPPVTPMASVFYQPSEQNQPKSGGWLSGFAKPLTTLASPITSLFGSKTAPVTRTATHVTKPMSPTTPSMARDFRASGAADFSPLSVSDFIAEEIVFKSTPKFQLPTTSTSDPDLIQTPVAKVIAQKTPSARSVVKTPSGKEIPVANRIWSVRARRQQTEAYQKILQEEELRASGQLPAVLTPKQQSHRDQVLEKQEYLEAYLSRLRNKRTPSAGTMEGPPQSAGQKRRAEEDDEVPAPIADTPLRMSKRPRLESSTPLPNDLHLSPMQRSTIGYTSPTPSDPSYHHVNEDITMIDASLGKSPMDPDNAPGSNEPSGSTVGRTYGLLDDFDDEREEIERPAAPTPGRSYGLPDDFYDISSDEDEDEDEEEAEDPSTHIEEQPAPKFTIPPAFAHKYTPSRPSGLRMVDVASPPPDVVSPPLSPPSLRAASGPPPLPTNLYAPDGMLSEDFCTYMATHYYKDPSGNNFEVAPGIDEEVNQMFEMIGNPYHTNAEHL